MKAGRTHWRAASPTAGRALGRGPLRRWARRFAPLVAFIAAIWAAHLVNIALGGALTSWFGLVPRRLDGLDGVLGMPFLHADFAHLAANTSPLLVLGGAILLLTPERFARATAIIVLLGGGLAWVFARDSIHIGASGLIFGWFGYLVALGVVERSWRALIGAAFALALYGAPMLIGATPFADAGSSTSAGGDSVSWDGHLAGLVAGIVAAGSGRRRAARA